LANDSADRQSLVWAATALKAKMSSHLARRATALASRLLPRSAAMPARYATRRCCPSVAKAMARHGRRLTMIASASSDTHGCRRCGWTGKCSTAKPTTWLTSTA
jgi:hypothetical protein